MTLTINIIIICYVGGLGSIYGAAGAAILLNILTAALVWRITPHRVSFTAWDRPALQAIWKFGANVLGYTGLTKDHDYRGAR